MIEMQYNFPLLPGLPAQWRDRLCAAVRDLGAEDFDALRPTFRSAHPELVEVAARWLKLPADRLFLTMAA